MDEDSLGCPSETAMAGRAEACQNCPGKALCQSISGSKEDVNLQLRMKVIRHKIVILSGKGGVGKSSVTANLAIALSARSKSVGVLDADICGPSIPKLLSIEGEQIVNSQWGWKTPISPLGNIKVVSVGSMLESDESAVIFRGPRKTHLLTQFLRDVLWGRLDFLLFDTPPGTSDEHLTIVRLLKSIQPDGAVLVTTPAELALQTIRKEINFCRKMGLNILGIVENMSGFVCPCCQESYPLFQTNSIEQLAASQGIRYLGRIPVDPSLTMAGERGQSLFTDPSNPSPGVKHYNQIVDRLLSILIEKE